MTNLFFPDQFRDTNITEKHFQIHVMKETNEMEQ